MSERRMKRLDEKRETAAGTEMQEKRLVDTNEKWKDEGIMF